MVQQVPAAQFGAPDLALQQQLASQGRLPGDLPSTCQYFQGSHLVLQGFAQDRELGGIAHRAMRDRSALLLPHLSIHTRFPGCRC